LDAQILFLVAMFALLWFVLIRPQRAKQQRQRQMLEAIEPGDEIMTVGGLIGIVQSIDEDEELIVEIADGIHVRISRRAVANVVKPDAEGADEGDEDLEDADGEELAGDASDETEEALRKDNVA
jgi:preprotein translocase subunit YajC